MRARQRKTPRARLEELLELGLRSTLSTYDGGLPELAIAAELSLAQLYRFTAGEGSRVPLKTAGKIAGALAGSRDRVLQLLKTAELVELWQQAKAER